jgi:CubicO group peptidase (beta-lactamase class C family)
VRCGRKRRRPRRRARRARRPRVAPSGATFTLPKGWTFSATPQFVVAQPPEADTHVAIVDVGEATDAKDAAAKAWALYRPEANHPFKLATARPPREGWDERAVIDYETSPNDKLTITAIALRAGTSWTVMILDASDATAEKRGAAIGLISASLRAAGYQRETFAGRSAHPLDAARVAALQSFVQTSMRQLGVPGVGLALIDHGKLIYEGGLGVKALGQPDPVDAHTLFMIASNTKGMSTLLLAEEVDQGKLAWDQPVTQVYPAFKLGSADTTRQVLMRHLVCACTGLPRKDFDWIFDTRRDTPASTTFAQLADTQPTSGFGEVFQYNNLMASAAGYIGGHLYAPDRELGAAYDLAMQRMVFVPLGMRETTFDMARAQAGDHASPHGDDLNGKPALASMDFNYAVVPYRPAGGAWSSAHDMSRYVLNELNLGKLPSGRQLVSAKNLLARRAKSVPTGEDGYYGMGLEVDTTWGVEVVHHGGSMAGYKSDWIAIPEAGVGAVILTNADTGRMMLRPFMRRLLEVMYDGKLEAAGDVAAAAARNQAEIAKDRERLVVPAAADLTGALAPAYASPDLGSLKVVRDGARTVFDFGLWKSEVASRKNDDGTVSFVAIDPAVSGFEFVVAQRDGKRALVIRDSQHEYVYTEAS